MLSEENVPELHHFFGPGFSETMLCKGILPDLLGLACQMWPSFPL